uniref:glucuronyl esterase domain-containing protein n=1 Tax=Alistipes sp. TaxID=1872444 RepID=UPI0040578D28
MKRLIILALLLWGVIMVGDAKKFINYDEKRASNYTLPELLTCQDGTKVTTVEQWEKHRRPELLKMFSNIVYGQTPVVDDLKVKYKVIAENKKAFGGKATAQQVMFTFSRGKQKLQALVLVHYPNNSSKRVPVFIGYNFRGNHSLTKDEWVEYSPYFVNYIDKSDKLMIRGQKIGFWPIEEIVTRGYAAVTLCYHDIYPDRVDGLAGKGLFELLPKSADDGSRWQAIGVWSYALSRVTDWVVKQPWANKEQLAVIGHSRQGKVALWTGVQDKRFKVVISNNSGCGGAALSKRVYGEDVRYINKRFPHWFCTNFAKYSNREQDLSIDQHQLLAMVAPRFLYVASASEDRWADPKGEYLATYHASPVYELYGLKGLTSAQMPEIGKPIHNNIGYHLREGKHALRPYDWNFYMDFCDKAFKRTK